MTVSEAITEIENAAEAGSITNEERDSILDLVLQERT